MNFYFWGGFQWVIIAEDLTWLSTLQDSYYLNLEEYYVNIHIENLRELGKMNCTYIQMNFKKRESITLAIA